MVKSVGTGVLISAVLTAVMTLTAAFVLNMMSAVPYGLTDYIMIAVQGVSVLIGSYIASALAKSKGLIIGLLCAGVVFLIILAFGMSDGKNSIGIITAIRAVVLSAMGILGGIWGVNRKERVHIR